MSRSVVLVALAALALGGSLPPASGRAEPLDVTDPTPRAIQVEFEISEDPTVVGQAWSAPFEAQYSAAGNLGTVVISAAEYARAIQTHELDFFDLIVLWSLVSGSAPVFQLDIDLTTLEATAQTASHEIALQITPVQNGTVTRELATTATAGFAFHPDLEGFPFFCASSEIAPCLIVPGSPYDPATGTLHAVGSDFLDAPDAEIRSFARAGDLRLSELPASAVPLAPAAWLGGTAVLLAAFARRRFGARRR